MRYIQILLLCLLISCQNQETNSVNQLGIDFFDQELSWSSNEPILKIFFESNECGEWGGHEEYMTVSKKNEKKYKLEYQKYNVNCDSMVKVFDGARYQIRPQNNLIKEEIIEINENEKKAILNFSIDMVKSKFKGIESISHAEIRLSICNSDSTFYIWQYGGSLDNYHKLLAGLKIY